MVTYLGRGIHVAGDIAQRRRSVRHAVERGWLESVVKTLRDGGVDESLDADVEETVVRLSARSLCIRTASRVRHGHMLGLY